MLPEAISEKIQRALVTAKRLQMGGHLADARRACQLVLELDPDNAEARLRLGVVARLQGQAGEAVAQFAAVVMRQPDNALAVRQLAVIQRESGRLDEAEQVLDRALAAGLVDAPLLVERGRCHMDRGQVDQALPLFEQAVTLAPDYPPAQSMLGVTYRRLDRRDEARAAFTRTLALAPQDLAALNGLGNACLEAEDFGQAIDYYRRALAVKPDFVSAQKNLAYTLGLANRLAEARGAFERLLALAPGNQEAHMDYGLFLLSVGDYARGWAEYDYRWTVAKFDERDWGLGLPRWDGTGAGRVLLWAEQGIGDQVLYGSLLPDMLARGSNEFVVAVEPRLVPLFARSLAGPRVQVVERGATVEAVAQCPFGSMGQFVRHTAADFGSGAYLRVDPALRERLRARYAALGGSGDRLVGLSWRSANWHLGDYKSLSLEILLPLLRQPGHVWVNLQYGDVGAEIAQLAERHGIAVHCDPEIDPTQNLDGLAAQIAALDAVVSSSNSTVHLAGALGQPCHVLLPAGRGRMWYWPREGETSPWYASIRLLRQQTAGDWSAVVTRAIESLRADG